MSEFATPLNRRAAIDRAAAALAATSPSPRLDAEVLVRHACGATRTDIIAHPDRPIDDAVCAVLAALVARRRAGEPIAYITGTREFWSLELHVTPETLIPRPETELLVERVLAHIATEHASVADLGTGSGAVALALARERPDLHLVATDCTEAAIAVARGNAARLHIATVEFLVGDWFTPLHERRFHVVLSNPPYVRTHDPRLSEGDVRFEPSQALVGGPDGLRALRHLIAGARDHLLPGGWLLLEHGSDQGAKVRALLDGHGYTAVQSFRDLAGHERVTEARLPSE